MLPRRQRRAGTAAVDAVDARACTACGGGVDRPPRHLGPQGPRQAGRRPGHRRRDRRGRALLGRGPAGRRWRPVVLLPALAALKDDGLPPEQRLAPGPVGQVGAALAGPDGCADLTAAEPAPMWVDRPRAAGRRLVRAVPPQLRRPGRGRPTGCRRWRPWGSTCCTCRRSIRSAPPTRKGRNNTLGAGPDDPGSPWAIGSAEGGHTAIDPEPRARSTTSPSWSTTLAEHRHGGRARLRPAVLARPSLGPRASGVVPPPPRRLDRLRREPAQEVPGHLPDQLLARGGRRPAWRCGTRAGTILEFWIEHGVRIFRVDNPHTKPIAFWEWLIPAVQTAHPDIVLLAEAFTRPKVMAKLAEVGFSQSYTYFTWRTEQHGPEGLRAYLEELAGPQGRLHAAQLLAEHAGHPVRAAARRAARRVRPAAGAGRHLAPSWGMYSGYELYENEPASDSNEEYLHLREVRDQAPRLRPARQPRPADHRGSTPIRRRPSRACSGCAPSASTTADNPQIIAYSKVERRRRRRRS